jgi:universal stress protein E
MPIKRRIRRILVAIKDPEARALPALAKAAQLARGLDAELVLFQAIDAPLYLEADVARRGGLKDIERRGRAASLARLERRARRLRRLGIRVSVSAEWDYPAYEAVVRAAGPAGVDLIVAERHAGRHFAAGLLHLTDWELLRLSPIPVLLVKRPGRYRRPVVLAAVDPDKRYAKPERLDREILQAGAQLADALRGTLHVVHAYSPLPLTAYTRGTLSEATLKDMQRRSAEAAGEKLERLVRPSGVPAARRHLIARHPPDAIEQAAAETRSALVVMGALARSGLRRLLIGNTAERVLNHLPCDLLVIKAEGFGGKVPRRRRGARYVSLPSGLLFY